MTIRAIIRPLILVCAAWLAPVPAAAAIKFQLSVSPATVVLSAGDPDAAPSVVAAPVTVTYRVTGASPRDTWQLTVLANGDLLSGPSTVDITNVTWTATPAPPFQNGTLSRTTAQRMASGSGNENRTGSLTFRLANSWTYTAGTYTQTLVFTLSSP